MDKFFYSVEWNGKKKYIEEANKFIFCAYIIIVQIVNILKSNENVFIIKLKFAEAPLFSLSLFLFIENSPYSMLS